MFQNFRKLNPQGMWSDRKEGDQPAAFYKKYDTEKSGLILVGLQDQVRTANEATGVTVCAADIFQGKRHIKLICKNAVASRPAPTSGVTGRFTSPKSLFVQILSKLIFLSLVVFPNSAYADRRLSELYHEKQCFDLRDSIKNAAGLSPDELFYRAVVANQFNQPRLSIALLQRFLKQQRDATITVEAYQLLVDDYRKLFQYGRAARVLMRLIYQFGNTWDAEKKEDAENELRLCSALANIAPQTTTFHGDSIVLRDGEGRYPMSINGVPVSLALDSGANISVITSSMARSLRLQLINASVDVGAFAGNKVKSKLAVARDLKIGRVVVRNAVFLVFEDKDLFVTDANFQINGLIGFPVIASFREMTFVQGESMILPMTTNKKAEQNMCLDRQLPLVAAQFKGAHLTFVLDTGATASVLFPSFFRKYETEIKQRYPAYNETIRGVGGQREINGYLAKDLVFTIGGQSVRLTHVPVLTEETNENSRYFDGNLGQDVVNQFKRMTLNFETMSVTFK